MTGGRLTITLAADVTAFNAAMDRARSRFTEFAARVMANPEARAAFHRAQRASPPPMPCGAYYRARTRRRTRRNR